MVCSVPDNTASPMARSEPVADEDGETSPLAAYSVEDDTIEVEDEEPRGSERHGNTKHRRSVHVAFRKH